MFYLTNLSDREANVLHQLNDLVGFIVAFAAFRVLATQIRHKIHQLTEVRHRFQNERILQMHSHLDGKELHCSALSLMALFCWRSV